MSESVKIAVRVRPDLPAFISDETIDEQQSALHIPAHTDQIIIADGRPFAFDHIFEAGTSQEYVYNSLIQPMVCKMLEGFNATALAYGQTGTGKTYTMGLQVDSVNEENVGMLMRTMQDLFEKLSEESLSTEYEVSISFIEIYNEKAYDLIDNSPEPINVKGQKFTGGSKRLVLNVEQARKIVLEGNKNRHVRPTKMNSSSSRSHAVFTVYASIKRNGVQTSSSLHIVDLAGSEGIRRTGHVGMALAEGVNINQGLLSIGKVLQALSTGSKVIPYRDSFLTTVLQSSLNPNSYLTLLACISPMTDDISETLSTLRFAQNVKTLKHNPHINTITAEYIKAKTPRKSLAPPLRHKNAFVTPGPGARKRPNTDENINNFSTIKKPAAIHSNTFCTPSKLRKVDLFQHNNTHLGNLSAGKKKLNAAPEMMNQHIIQIDDLAELQYFNQDMPRSSIDSRSSILSLNISSSTSIDVPPKEVSYSPLVKRCMAEFEVTIDEKLKKMFENLQNITLQNANQTMQQPQRTVEGPAVEQVEPDTTIHTTVNPPWLDTMRQELQNIVRAELTTIMASNANSEQPKSPFKRPPSLPVTSTVRKDFPFVKRTTANKAIVPTPFNETTFARRRTINLSCLPEEEAILERTVFMSDDNEFFAMPPPPTRQGVRGSKRFSRAIEKENEAPPVAPSALVRRRSCRISMKFNRHEPKTNAVVPEVVAKPSKPAKKGGARGAPLKNKVIADYFHSNESGKISMIDHKNAVLQLINCGSIKELQILPTIGLKTAFQLITNRTLKGKFKTFDEIAKLPMWRGKGWMRFQQENNLI